MIKKRIILLSLAFALLAVFGCEAYVEGPRTAPAWHPASAVAISYFYDALAPHGDWFWVEPWGWVWTPWDVEPGWRPYTRGHWAWTSLGWTWVSDWPWGWAPFHYGRWTYDLYHGWIWIPDRIWAPAWVAWRSGHGWIGWAPLPPGARWQIGVGLDLGGVDLTYGIVHHSWSFVHERHFLEPRIWRHVEPLPRNAHRLRETEDRTRYEEVDRQVAVRGIGVEEIERSAGPVRRYPVEEVAQPPRGAARIPKPPDQGEPSEGKPPDRRPTRPPAQPPTKPVAEEGAPPQPPPSLDRQPAERRTARETREVGEWEQRERQRLDEDQRQERRQKPPGATVAELERRQEEERRALQKEVEREKQLVENRRDRRAQEQAQAEEQAKEPAREKPREPKKPPERER